MFLTMHAEPVMFERAMAIGVQGYVLKDAALSEIVQAVRTCDRPHLSEPGAVGVSPRTLVSARRDPAAGRVPLARLNERERHVLRLIAASKTSKEIAGTLGLHYRTVENLRAAMSQKLGLQGSHALVKFAFDHRDQL